LFGKTNGGEGLDKFDCKFYRFEQPNVVVGFDREATICPYGVSPTKFARMIEIHVHVQDLFK
jgi:hypothetical protein